MSKDNTDHQTTSKCSTITIWHKYCVQEVKGYGINTGHYLAEENPDEIIKSIHNFLK